MASIWASGRIWLRVPETLRIKLTGSFRKGVYARDVIMSLIGELKEDGGNYKSLEWNGKGMSIDSRACICNNSIECGATNSVFEADALTERYLKKMGRKPLIKVKSGKKASAEEMEIELDSLEPQVTPSRSTSRKER